MVNPSGHSDRDVETTILVQNRRPSFHSVNCSLLVIPIVRDMLAVKSCWTTDNSSWPFVDGDY